MEVLRLKLLNNKILKSILQTNHVKNPLLGSTRNKTRLTNNKPETRYWRYTKMAARTSQKFDYFLVLDFEATCEYKEKIVQEIIEFPCLKVNGKTMAVESVFHTYIQPQVNPQLTPFCVELTGINQDMVSGQPHFEQALHNFNLWMDSERLFEPTTNFAFVTCGDWDLRVMLPAQCEVSHLAVPRHMKSWINIKKEFSSATSEYPKGILDMMTQLHLVHQGRLHSGIDDCKNIAVILKALADKGHIFEITGHRK